MATGASPIPLGSAAQSTLVPDKGSNIRTNDFGVDFGTVRHSLGSQLRAQGMRPRRGEPYAGTLPQFKGMFVDRSGIIGAEGNACFVDVDYKAINTGWGVPPPDRSHELEQRDINLELGLTKYQMSNLLIPHPLVTYKFASSKATNALGSYRADLANAPEVDIFTWHSRIPVIEVNADGSFTVVSIDVVDIKFIPDPSGWFCLKDDNSPCCGGRFFEVEQQWRRALVFFGVEAGSGRQP